MFLFMLTDCSHSSSTGNDAHMFPSQAHLALGIEAEAAKHHGAEADQEKGDGQQKKKKPEKEVTDRLTKYVPPRSRL